MDLKADFPALAELRSKRPLVFLDNASTTQKPASVLAAIDRAYRQQCANVHRGVHELSARATDAYEGARDKVRGFIGAGRREEIVFTRGTTESINLVAQSYGRRHVGVGDRVLVSEMEHHSNLVPWQLLCQERGAELVMLPMTDDGELRLDVVDSLLDERTRLLAVTQLSNSLGTVNDIAWLCAKAHQVGALVMVDGAQAVAHLPVDVQALDCDFYAFSGHKMYGPTGIGVLYGRYEQLEAMPPWQGGGDMIAQVSFGSSSYAALPYKFEAGTPHIAGAIGLGAAIDWLQAHDRRQLHEHEQALLGYATERLREQSDVRLIGVPAAERSHQRRVALVSFLVGDIHPHDVGTILDLEGVAVRAGHHCTQPIMDHYDLAGTVRASFAAYNTRQDVERLIVALDRVRETFR